MNHRVQSQNSTIKASLAILLAAILFSTGGAAIKACAFDGWQVAWLRSAIASVFLLIFIPQCRKKWDLATLLVGASFAATMTLYVLANKLTTSANTIFLQATAPIYLLIFCPYVLKEKNSRNDILFLIALAIGMLFFFIVKEAPQTSAPSPGIGNTLAIISGISWAGTVGGLRYLAKRQVSHPQLSGSPLTATLCGNVLAALLCLPFGVPLPHTEVMDWVLISHLGIFQIGLAYLCLTWAVKKLYALKAALLLLLEPVLNPLWAWFFQGELPAPLARVGCCIILAATVWHSWAENSKQKDSSTS